MTETATHSSRRTIERRGGSHPLMALLWIAFITLMAFDAGTLDRIWQ